MATKDLSGINTLLFDVRASRSSASLPNPVSHWKMNDNAADHLVDDAMGTNDGTAVQHTDQLDSVGKINGALSFNGSTDWIDLGSPASLALAQFTICAWIKPTTVTGYYLIYGLADYPKIYIHTDGKLWLYDGVNGASSTSALVENVWSHIAVTSGGKYFINGQLNGTFTPLANYSTTASQTKIGRDPSGDTQNFPGLIDDVRVYNTALTEGQILGIYNSGLGTEDQNPVGSNLKFGLHQSNLIPIMTSNTAPSGTASADSVFGNADSCQPWHAFDRENAADYPVWHSDINDPHWIQYQFPSAVPVDKYAITARNDAGAGFHPVAWTLSGSNTGAFSGEQAVLDTQTAQDFTQAQKKSYSISNTTAYSYYRFNISLPVDYNVIGEIEMGGIVAEITPNITSADTFQTVTWDISGVADANKNAIDTFTITVVDATAENTFYVDNFGTIQTDVFGQLDHEIFPVIDVFGLVT